MAISPEMARVATEALKRIYPPWTYFEPWWEHLGYRTEEARQRRLRHYGHWTVGGLIKAIGGESNG